MVKLTKYTYLQTKYTYLQILTYNGIIPYNIKRDVDLYKEHILLKVNNKHITKTDIVCYLSEKYSLHKRTIWQILKDMEQEIHIHNISHSDD